MNTLAPGEIAERLRTLDGWSAAENCIEKHYEFKSFVRAMLFVNAVAYLAESVNHHPDFIIHYNRVTLRNWTHIAGGVTQRDFDLARRIDEIER